MEYDRQQQEAAQSAAIPLSASSTPSTPTVSPRASELFVTAAEIKPGATKPREKFVLRIVYVTSVTQSRTWKLISCTLVASCRFESQLVTRAEFVYDCSCALHDAIADWTNC